MQLSVALRNAALDAYETATGASPILTIRSGAAPANCAAANSGTVLATITLPADWMAAAAGGTKAMLGAWVDASADATGTAGHFRIHDSAGTTCHWQGTAGVGGGNDLVLDSAAFTAGQSFTVSGFTLTAANA